MNKKIISSTESFSKFAQPTYVPALGFRVLRVLFYYCLRNLANRQAGGFALEEPGLRSLVDKIEGSVDSVLGLPVDLLCTLVECATA